MIINIEQSSPGGTGNVVREIRKNVPDDANLAETIGCDPYHLKIFLDHPRIS